MSSYLLLKIACYQLIILFLSVSPISFLSSSSPFAVFLSCVLFLLSLSYSHPSYFHPSYFLILILLYFHPSYLSLSYLKITLRKTKLKNIMWYKGKFYLNVSVLICIILGNSPLWPFSNIMQTFLKPANMVKRAVHYRVERGV